MQDSILISFTAQHLDIVANALGQRPYIEAAPVLDSISRQIAAQNVHPESSPIEPPPPDGAPALQ